MVLSSIYNTGDEPVSLIDLHGVLDAQYSTILGKISYLETIATFMIIFPFKFFIAKEYFFILYDELRNKSLSHKIDNLKNYTSIKGVYTEDMVQKLRKDIYIVIR